MQGFATVRPLGGSRFIALLQANSCNASAALVIATPSALIKLRSAGAEGIVVPVACCHSLAGSPQSLSRLHADASHSQLSRPRP